MGNEVLIVDDSSIDIEIIANLLSWQGFTVTKTNSGQQALEVFEKHENSFDILIIDWEMPEMSGLMVCEKIRELSRRVRPYIFILTGNQTQSAELDALASGADSFLKKPFEPQILIARLKAVRKMIHHQKNIVNISERDSMTHLLNRGAGITMARKQLNRFMRFDNIQNCLVMADIDFFKRVNDSYGHNVGDEVIKFVAEVMRHQVRDYDTIARLGGEEFMLFIEADASETQKILQRIMAEIAIQRNYTGPEPFQVTLSFGCIEFSSEDTELDIESIMKKADELLYKAKESGRNRIVMEQITSTDNNNLLKNN